MRLQSHKSNADLERLSEGFLKTKHLYWVPIDHIQFHIVNWRFSAKVISGHRRPTLEEWIGRSQLFQDNPYKIHSYCEEYHRHANI